MQIEQTPTLYPGMCAVTGNTTGPVVDVGVDAGDWGRLYLDLSVVREMVGLLGYVDGEIVDRYKAELAAAEDRITELERERSIAESEAVGLAEALRIMATRDGSEAPMARRYECQYCSATESNKGTLFVDSKRALAQHERFCLDNPDRQPTVNERMVTP